jgi:hypothetical protein
MLKAVVLSVYSTSDTMIGCGRSPPERRTWCRSSPSAPGVKMAPSVASVRVRQRPPDQQSLPLRLHARAVVISGEPGRTLPPRPSSAAIAHHGRSSSDASAPPPAGRALRLLRISRRDTGPSAGSQPPSDPLVDGPSRIRRSASHSRGVDVRMRPACVAVAWYTQPDRVHYSSSIATLTALLPALPCSR